VRRGQHPTDNGVGTLVRVGLLVFLTSGLIACGPKSGGNSNSSQGSGSPLAAPEAAPARTEFKTGEAVPAGYLGYKVFGSWFSDQVETDARKAPAGNYLFVDLSVVNTDKKERAVAPLSLVDEAGKEYPLSDKAANIERSVGALGKIEPTVSKRAFAVFEVPQGHQYKLKIQGFSATESVTISLTPMTTPPKAVR
jgi:hypothetical protein